MTKTLKTFLTAGLLTLVVAAPAMADDSQFVSTVVGASLGGLVGSSIGHGDGRLAATGAGIIIGGAIGNELGRPSYAYARPYGYAPSYYSYDMFPSGTYNNYPYDMYSSRGYGVYQPTYVAPPDLPPQPQPQPVTYIDDDSGNYCRQYSQTIRIGNHVQESYGTACLQPDGSWHIVQ